jgi:hypothetical protein
VTAVVTLAESTTWRSSKYVFQWREWTSVRPCLVASLPYIQLFVGLLNAEHLILLLDIGVSSECGSAADTVVELCIHRSEFRFAGFELLLKLLETLSLLVDPVAPE